MRVKICPRCREANDDIAHVCMHCHESLIHVQSVEEGRADREAAPSLPTAGGADGAAPESGYAAGERTAGGELYIECVSGADFVKRIGDGDVLGRRRAMHRPGQPHLAAARRIHETGRNVVDRTSERE
jgi:hypothetical protein